MPKLKYWASSLALRSGFSIAKLSNLVDVEALLKSLWPVKTDLPLIRIGCDGDGGYLVPDDLDGLAACFSPGVDNRATFETALLERGIPCFLADATVQSNPVEHPSCQFIPRFLGVYDDDIFITADSWIDANAPAEGDLLLQMDIEGAEWQVLLNISERNLKRFRVIVIELHDMERLMDKHAFQIINAVLRRLERHFHVVHNHPNNNGGKVSIGRLEIPRALELSLLRKDRAQPTGFVDEFPHPLDQANDADREDIVLPAGWHA